MSKKIFTLLGLLGFLFVLYHFITPEHFVSFNTEVKPIFNKKCISCHGGVKRQGGFSLLFRSEALANTESGKPAAYGSSSGVPAALLAVDAQDQPVGVAAPGRQGGAV